jgi:drug/metabolite transporter (DMT)-like permease
MFSILFFYFLMASLFVFGKKACLHFTPTQLTAIRLLSMGVLFLGYSVIKKQVNWLQARQAYLLLLGFAVSAIVSDLFRFVSLQVLPASHSALVSTTSPFIAALLSYLVFNETISWQKSAALALGVVGILPLILHNLSILPQSSTAIIITGYGGAFLSTIGFIAVGIYIKKLGQQQFKLLTTLGIGLTIAGLLTTAFGIVSMQACFFETYQSCYQYLPIIIIPSIIGYPLYGYLVQAYPLTLVAFAQLSSPLWATLIAWFGGHNDISVAFVLSFCVLTLAFSFFYAQELKPKK